MADSAVSFFLDHLSIWLQEERKLLGGLRAEAQLIHDELNQMRAFLKAADAREESDPLLKIWVTQMREIAYDTEDVLESYMLRFGAHVSHDHGVWGGIKKTYASIKNLKAKHYMASQIKKLRSRTKNASETFEGLRGKLPAGSSSSGSASYACYDGRGDALLLEEVDLVGIEMPKKMLLKWISTTDSTLKVVSVVGMAGLGKTTLVKKVYEDPWVKQNIHHHAWINVSETYRVENLIQDLIKRLHEEVKQATPPRLETMTLGDLKEFLYDFLRNKKYIIVLDDIWSEDVWKDLQYAFPRTTTDGRGCIIITTRKRNVGDAACCESGGHVYDLQPLPEEEAKKLFLKKAFPGEHSCPHHLIEISDNILKRCGGLPLAIVVIGGVLATKRNAIDEWTNFSLNLGSELEEDNRMWKVLSLSYYDLPYHLKACLLFLSIFPEDHLIERPTIIRLWTAEGIVETKPGKIIEETAKGYLNELCNRSMVQIAEMTEDGWRPKTFRIHDVVREYIISKAREQSLVAVKSERGITLDDRIRRLALDDRVRNHIEQINNYKCLRTLLFFGSFNSEWRSILRNILHGGCRMLKELDLRGAPLDVIPDEVFKLYGLKYLCLRQTNVSFVPKSIGNLEKLETLDLKGCHVGELPIEIFKLQRLQYLLGGRYLNRRPYLQFDSVQSFKAPYGIGQLLCLRKLYYIDSSVNVEGIKIVKEIGRLKELRRLGIVKVRNADGRDLCCSLENLSYLRSVYISSFEEDEVIDLDYEMPSTSLKYLRLICLEGHLQKVPQWIHSLNALVTLQLRWSKMVEDPLECLQNLPNLQLLQLICVYEGEGLSFKSGGFPMLTELYMEDFRGLEWVIVEKGSMPSLKSLIIANCKGVRELPMGVEHLGHLELVRFIDMAEEFVENLIDEKRKNGDQWKLAHVPSILIVNWVDGDWHYRLP